MLRFLLTLLLTSFLTGTKLLLLSTHLFSSRSPPSLLSFPDAFSGITSALLSFFILSETPESHGLPTLTNPMVVIQRFVIDLLSLFFNMLSSTLLSEISEISLVVQSLSHFLRRLDSFFLQKLVTLLGTLLRHHLNVRMFFVEFCILSVDQHPGVLPHVDKFFLCPQSCNPS